MISSFSLSLYIYYSIKVGQLASFFFCFSHIFYIFYAFLYKNEIENENFMQETFENENENSFLKMKMRILFKNSFEN
jgi:hypothetical protein